jgi:tryptophan-rich sensory protein
MKARSVLVLLGFIAAAFVAAAIGGSATASSVQTWYPTLAKPSWNPPSGVFGPVWTMLYFLMAVAAWRVWRGHTVQNVRRELAGYFAQLALNAGWSLLFFGLRRPDLAFAEILLFWATLVWLQIRFWKIDRLAGALWALYLAWVSFATALNFAIWRLNA